VRARGRQNLYKEVRRRVHSLCPCMTADIARSMIRVGWEVRSCDAEGRHEDRGRRSVYKKVRRHILGLSVCFCQPVETGNNKNKDKINLRVCCGRYVSEFAELNVHILFCRDTADESRRHHLPKTGASSHR